jgi:hypothetical protein
MLRTSKILFTALIKKKIKFSSNIRKFRIEQFQSHKWLTASTNSSYIWKYLRISSYIRKPFLIYDHSEFPYIWGKFDFLFYQWVSCHDVQCADVLFVFSMLKTGNYACFISFTLLIHITFHIKSVRGGGSRIEQSMVPNAWTCRLTQERF